MLNAKPKFKLSSHQSFSLSLVTWAFFDLVSWFGWHSPLVSVAATVALSLAWLVIAGRNLGLGVTLLVAELILGSFGRLVEIEIGTFELSLRLVLFMCAFGLMIYRLARNRQPAMFCHPWRWWFVGALGALVWGAVVAYLRWNDWGALFLDANGYLYLLLLPLFVDACEVTRPPELLRLTKLVLVPAIIWLSLRTLVLLYLFTHVEINTLDSIYRWWRDQGLGEITPAGGNFFRIFSQSQIYSSLAAAIGFAWLWLRLRQGITLSKSQTGLIILWLALFATIASLSRSLWLGLAVAWCCSMFAAAKGAKALTYVKYILTSLVLITSATGVVLFTSRLSFPLPPLGSSSTKAFTDRFGKEPAAQARLKLLQPLWKEITQRPLTGSGFGATVLYYSQDPRIIRSTAGGSGLIRTYALEWGYLDLWLKLGLIGGVAYLGFLFRPLWLGLKLFAKQQKQGIAVLALVALSITHLTTPYLNHPLGLGTVLAAGAYLYSHRKSTQVYE